MKHVVLVVALLGCQPQDEGGDAGVMDDASTNPNDNPLPSAHATKLAVGEYVSCAVTTEGSLRCWGYEVDAPTIGFGMPVTALIPLQVAGLTSGVIDVAAGYYNTCAIVTGGRVKCWGNDEKGELGAGIVYTDNRPRESATPVDVVGVTGATALAIGWDHICALAGGAVSCWGHNDQGQLGDGTTTDSNVPVGVVGLPAGITAIAAGSDMSYAVTAAGGVKVWGGGFGNTPVDLGVAGTASGVASLTWGAYDMGSYSLCIVTTAGQAKCFGTNNDYGQLGNGNETTTSPDTAQPVMGISGGATGISLGSMAACATVGGTAKCWGGNLDGQLGNDGDPTLHAFSAVDVVGLSGVKTVKLGFHHACALNGDGAVKCWGGGGMRGDRSTSSDVPVPHPVDVVSLP